jgi:hypothetical protein
MGQAGGASLVSMIRRGEARGAGCSRHLRRARRRWLRSRRGAQSAGGGCTSWSMLLIWGRTGKSIHKFQSVRVNVNVRASPSRCQVKDKGGCHEACEDCPGRWWYYRGMERKSESWVPQSEAIRSVPKCLLGCGGERKYPPVEGMTQSTSRPESAVACFRVANAAAEVRRYYGRRWG